MINDNAYFTLVDSAVRAAGMTGSLVQTGGGVMVYYVDGPGTVTVGVDVESIVTYIDDVPVSEPVEVPANATMADVMGAVQLAIDNVDGAA